MTQIQSLKHKVLMTTEYQMTEATFSKRGAIGILTTLVMGLVLVMVAVSMVLTGISSRANALTLSQSENALVSTEGCAEDTLIQLSRNHDYPGTSLSVNGVGCLTTVQGSGDTRDILVVGSSGTITHNLLIQISFVPTFHIVHWAD